MVGSPVNTKLVVTSGREDGRVVFMDVNQRKLLTEYRVNCPVTDMVGG